MSARVMLYLHRVVAKIRTSMRAKFKSSLPQRWEFDPCDWDHESYCCKSDGMPATHRVLTGMVGDEPVYEMVCCAHANPVKVAP